MENKKQAYEWVITMTKGDPVVLTENQYKAYGEAKSLGTVQFETFEINPSFVVSAIKRPAQELLKMYPCMSCIATGHSQGGVCPNCEGTGLDTNQEAVVPVESDGSQYA